MEKGPRVVFKDEYFCDECGDFIGHIDNGFYLSVSDRLLCKECNKKWKRAVLVG